MSTRILNVIVYLVLAGVALVVHFQMISRVPMIPGDVGSGFFPLLLAWSMIILCIVGVIKTLMSDEDGKFEIDKAPRIIATLVIMGIWVLAWQYFGYFYQLEFLLLIVLFTFYRMDTGITRRQMLEHLVLAAAVTGISWLVFNQLIYIDL